MYFVIASAAKQSRAARKKLDCFAALAMTGRELRSNPQIPMLQLRLGDQLLGRAAPHGAAALDDVVAVRGAGGGGPVFLFTHTHCARPLPLRRQVQIFSPVTRRGPSVGPSPDKKFWFVLTPRP